MGSVFTFDTDIPRISSPWLQPHDAESGPGTPVTPQAHNIVLADCGVTKLKAEPQEGPTEYKLHLLLRPRRTYVQMSTVRPNPAMPQAAPPALSSTNQTRQSRFEHLTTQLLWRLQQSSPFNSATTKSVILPQLPDDTTDLDAAMVPGKLVPGLEESRGALYEIGVSDDGTLVGLARDELDESISALRVMAASLGCKVDILRTVIVGDCEWVDMAGDEPHTRHDKLWVAEALVLPDLQPRSGQNDHAATNETPTAGRGHSVTDQLRISLTGPTTSGKSTLLGTLSSGTLDNGRGMSRQNMLRHRHEVNSGVTSSVSQELVGYRSGAIISYAHPDIESWVDIHNGSEGGRLVFMSDSGGHPRYRRTVIRGLVGWDPHWTVLCISSEDGTSSSALPVGEDALGISGKPIDFAQAHLQLCLTLKIPLAIVVTKVDVANMDSLRKVLNKVLDTVKAAGRTPCPIKSDQISHPNLTSIPQQDDAKIKAVMKRIDGYDKALTCVPILLTSAVKGTGIGLVHALLESLPLPPKPTSTDFVGMALNPEQPRTLFHVDDTFTLPSSYSLLGGMNEHEPHMGVVVSGYLRFGVLAVGDKVVVGPFDAEDGGSGQSTPGVGLSISHPSSSELSRIAIQNSVSASTVKGQWHDAQVVSIHSLRLPVLSLEAGQVGSIGIVFAPPPKTASEDNLPERLHQSMPRIRRGMVIAIPSSHMIDTGLSLQAASSVTASFNDSAVRSLTIGSLVNVYVANVAAAAKVQDIIVDETPTPQETTGAGVDMGDFFGLDEQLVDSSLPSQSAGTSEYGKVQVVLELLNHREWIELGSRILISEGGRHDKSGLEGFLGKVVEIVD